MNLERLYEINKYNTVKQYVFETIKKYSENIAFILKQKIDGKKTYVNKTYKELGEDIKQLGTGLIDLGLQNERIAVIGVNSYEWVTTYVSTMCGVGIIVPLDKGLQIEELKSSLKRSKAKAIIFDDKFNDIMKELSKDDEIKVEHYIALEDKENIFESYENIKLKGKELLEKKDKRFEQYNPNPDEIATIIFTSGTTSMSKAVMLSNRNIASNLYDLLSTEYVDNNDTNLLFLPFHHVFGSTGLLFFLCSGTKNAFCDGLRYVQENLKEYKVTTFVCVPLLLEAMYKKIWTNIKKQKKTGLIKFAIGISNILLKFKIDIRRKIFKPILDELGGNIRFIISGASAINKDVAKGFNDFGILTIQGYGLTETSPVLAAESYKHIRYGSVGLPFPSVEIKIENKDENGIGEIVAKGPNIMMGYYEMKDETKDVLKNKWFYTGDLGYLDKDGYLFITGRKKNVIVLKNGKNVYPEEIEKLISKLPYVSEVIVYGLPKDDDLLVSAKVVYNKEYVKEKYSDISEDELKEIIWSDIKEINKSMPRYKYVKNLIIQDTPMVKTSTAKIKRFEEIKKG